MNQAGSFNCLAGNIDSVMTKETGFYYIRNADIRVCTCTLYPHVHAM